MACVMHQPLIQLRLHFDVSPVCTYAKYCMGISTFCVILYQAGDNSPRVPKLGSGLKLAPDDEDVCPTCLDPYADGELCNMCIPLVCLVAWSYYIAKMPLHVFSVF